MNIPSKIFFFFWTCLKGNLLTLDVLQNCDLFLPNVYPLCLLAAESIEHIFIICPFASEVWTLFLKEIGLSCVLPKGMDLLLSWDIYKVSKK